MTHQKLLLSFFLIGFVGLSAFSQSKIGVVKGNVVDTAKTMAPSKYPALQPASFC
jgi:hypothetical protein